MKTKRFQRALEQAGCCSVGLRTHKNTNTLVEYLQIIRRQVMRGRIDGYSFTFYYGNFWDWVTVNPTFYDEYGAKGKLRQIGQLSVVKQLTQQWTIDYLLWAIDNNIIKSKIDNVRKSNGKRIRTK